MDLLDGSAQRWFPLDQSDDSERKRGKEDKGGGDVVDGQLHPDMWTDESFSLHQGEEIDDRPHFILQCSDFFVVCGRLTLSVTLHVIICICTLSENVHRGRRTAFVSVCCLD